ncbi:serine hydrolase [Alteromonas pelagimontana]|uniref:Serine hydrolase n=1 Tax=Alteromonas pelagimontana TaxID=1858656 RepID=A0A6M4MCN8_9ALTE|nr:serine hydrolase [Alteromonas pelagimontana]QJR80807.1 serine hydrolase [Alteromonas pelagimontana]
MRKNRRVTSWGIAIFCCLASLSTFAAETSEQHKWAIERIDSYLTRSVDKGFSGALLIASDENILLKKGYGLANRQAHEPVNPSTLFDIGSVTKQFTAAAILLLEDRNKLSVNDTLAKYFDNLPPEKQVITLHQLLTHSSGLISDTSATDFELTDTDAFFKEVFAAPLQFTPGSGFAYSNVGYSLLARIIELTSNLPYERFMHDNIFIPAGMKDTGYLLPDWTDNTAAVGYHYSVLNTGTTLSKYQKDGDVAWSLKGNGGLLSSLNDMFQWSSSLRNHTVLSTAQTKKLITPYVKENEDSNTYYAYGLAVFDSPTNTQMVGHNGSNGTFYFDFRWLVEEDIVILYASNAMVDQTADVSVNAELMLFDNVFNPPAFSRGVSARILHLAAHFNGTPEALKKAVVEQFGSELNKRYYLNRAGLALLQNGASEKAIVLLLLNVERFKDDGNLWDSLGEAYFIHGNKAKAKESFEKALALQPEQQCYWCENAQMRLNMLNAQP